jgi:hypothetical protein
MNNAMYRLTLLLVGIALAMSSRASADTESCSQAHAGGQRHENAGHLREALASFQECASDAKCPLPIRNECAELYTTVDGRLPTLVFSVVDGYGSDVVEVKVSSGDTQVASSLDGRPIAVDPGLHEFRFTLPTGEVLTKSVLVRQGEKDRIVSLRLPRTDLGAAEPAAANTELVVPSRDARATKLTMPVGAWVSYGVGVAALGAWGTFALLGRNAEKSLIECSPNCQATERDKYDTMKQNYLVADISLGVAAASVVTGTILLLTMGRREKAGTDRATAGKTRRALSVSPVALGLDGGLLKLEWRY